MWVVQEPHALASVLTRMTADTAEVLAAISTPPDFLSRWPGEVGCIGGRGSIRVSRRPSTLTTKPPRLSSMCMPPVTQCSDADLVTRTRRGDATAFDALVRRHYRHVYLIALSILCNQMDGEDCAQEVFLKVLHVIDECHSPDRFVAWLSQIARNTARNAVQTRRVRHVETLDVAQAAPADTRIAERDELRQRLQRALATLTDTQRSVVVLHDLEGLDHASIADTLGMTAVSSRQHLFNARQLLRAQLGVNAVTEFIHE